MKVRKKVEISGVVQGVGFRPFVYQLAKRWELTGLVKNVSSVVLMEIEGEAFCVDHFLQELRQAPPRAVIETLTIQDCAPAFDTAFVIAPSEQRLSGNKIVPPDAAVCAECLRELFNPQDRRYRYPFINCTNCGPRFSIIKGVPYDRERTTMADFAMCATCQAEYLNPLDRRFHAQPNACHACGPHLFLSNRDGQVLFSENAALEKTISALKQGSIVAVKGLGGFQLMANPFLAGTCQTLRERKQRADKPFALMADGLASIAAWCEISPREQQLLCSPERPIVLLKVKQFPPFFQSVAPGLDTLGFMLPNTPLHYLLFAEDDFKILVCTSANAVEEPMIITHEECVTKLGAVADFFLGHDRPIHFRCDDSVMRCVSEIPQFFRLSRGYAPRIFELSGNHGDLLGVGGELKSTICLWKKGQALLSPYIGDLKNLAVYQTFEQLIAAFLLFYDVHPEQVICDLHPAYLSTSWALESGLPLLALQHHKAHIYSVMADHAYDGAVLGIVMDGMGYGEDGLLWGGEFFIDEGRGLQRAACFEQQKLLGGDVAVKEIWRLAQACCLNAYGDDGTWRSLACFQNIPQEVLNLTESMWHKNINAPLTSSAGRLFDAVAALLGLKQHVSYEAQAALMLEAILDPQTGAACYPWSWQEEDELLRIQLKELIRAVVADKLKRISNSVISGKFHQTLVQIFLEVTRHLSQKTGIRTVAFSGGCFQNQFLFQQLLTGLQREHYRVLYPRHLPANDMGIALGQVFYALKRAGNW